MVLATTKMEKLSLLSRIQKLQARCLVLVQLVAVSTRLKQRISVKPVSIVSFLLSNVVLK